MDRKIELKNISEIYRDLDKLFHDFCDKSITDKFTEDFRRYLLHLNDFDPFNFAVINYDTVITLDSVNGDVLGINKIDEFLQQALLDYVINYED